MQGRSRQYGSERTDRDKDRIRSRSRSRRRSHSPRSRSRERQKRRDKEDKKYRDRSRSSDRGRRHSRRSSSRDNTDRRRRSSSRRRNGEQREKVDENSSGPKPVTLKDIISVNPGISMPEAVMKLNSYNSAIARGENPPPLFEQQISAGSQTATIGEGGALTKSQREIYVGNLPPGLAVPQLSEFLNAAMKQIGVGKDQSSVVTAWISPDAHYAFVEFRTVEEANAALNQLNGIQVGNYSLRFGRTKGYAGSINTESNITSSQLLSLSTLASGLLHPGSSTSSVPTGHASIIAEPLSDVIMVTNIPPILDEQQVKDLFTPFGELKVFNIIKTVGNQGQSAVFEYVQSSVADAVVSGMNNLDVIGQKLSVQKVPQSSAAVLLKPLKSASEKKAENLESYDDAKATKILRLSNMVTEEDLADDELYSELIEDVADECNQYGKVLSVIIPRSSNNSINENALGKIFVQLSDLEGSKRVRKAVSGRKFNGKIVEAEFFPEELFQKQIYSIPSEYDPAKGVLPTGCVDLD